MENDGIFTFPTDLAVERGDLLGLVVIPGSGVGARATEGATTERWIPHLALTRPPDFAAGQGFDHELLLRVELVPGGKQRLPQQVVGAAAERLPPGRLVSRRRTRYLDGRRVEIDVVAVGKHVLLDELLEGRRVTRIALPGFRAGGRVVTLEVTPGEDSVDVYVEYVGADSARILSHYGTAEPRGFVFVN